MKTALLILSLTAAPLFAQLSTDTPAPPANSTGSTPAKTTAKPSEWLLGTWTFDAEYTAQKQAQPKKEVGLADIPAGAVVSQLNEKLKGARLVVTDKEFTMTRADGNGKSESYTLLPNSDPNVAQLKQSDGEVLAFHREGDRIWMASTGSVAEPFYFKRGE